VLVFSGLVSLGVGLWNWFHPWLALTVMGALLLLLGLAGSIWGKK
jgi:hypothetical protein